MNFVKKPISIAILGSTGSIGQQTLDVIEKHPKYFEIFALTCYQNIELLEEQIIKFHPRIVGVYSLKKESAT